MFTEERFESFANAVTKIPSKSHKRVRELSSRLRRLPYHVEAARKQTFRNPDGVASKLQNLKFVSTHKWLQNTSGWTGEILA
jgi:5-methylcytosine-specific restriction protein A